ncbi:FCD domain-containing protein [Streptomyces sp. NBC_01462]|uniref:FCD domain-containing protein n=1 Tax=Streptomyces sp. NBC_01462 TaxID=2903876 RepID=UPI002E380018|nr:hypothetical protein [Streptomyces sp. NBC_01462]
MLVGRNCRGRQPSRSPAAIVLILLVHRLMMESEKVRSVAAFAAPVEVRGIKESARTSLDAADRCDARTLARADVAFHGAVGAASRKVFLRRERRR